MNPAARSASPISAHRSGAILGAQSGIPSKKSFVEEASSSGNSGAPTESRAGIDCHVGVETAVGADFHGIAMTQPAPMVDPSPSLTLSPRIAPGPMATFLPIWAEAGTMAEEWTAFSILPVS